MTRHALPCVVLLLLASTAAAQSPEGEPERRGEIETDRDSFTPATTLAGPRRWIFESSYSFTDNRGAKETHSLPEFLIRYGLTERLELRLGFNYEVGGAGSDVSASAGGEDDFFGVGLRRETRATYGVKAKITEQDGWLPGSALIATGVTPTSGSGTDTQVFGTYVFGWELPGGAKLDSALRFGTASEERDRFNVWAPSVVLKVPVAEKINVHAEWFALFSDGKDREFTRHFVSPGVHYLITPDVEVGVRVGWGLNDQSARFFANVGVGVRF